MKRIRNSLACCYWNPKFYGETKAKTVGTRQDWSLGFNEEEDVWVFDNKWVDIVNGMDLHDTRESLREYILRGQMMSKGGEFDHG